MIFLFAQQRDNPQPHCWVHTCTIKLLKPPALGSLPTCWPALPLDLPQDLLFWRPFWQRVVDNGDNWWSFSPFLLALATVDRGLSISTQPYCYKCSTKLSTTGVRAVLSLGLTFLPGRPWTSTGFLKCKEIVKGCSFHCITPSVIIIVASKAFGAWLPQEFALDWEFHDKVRQFKYFGGIITWSWCQGFPLHHYHHLSRFAALPQVAAYLVRPTYRFEDFKSFQK